MSLPNAVFLDTSVLAGQQYNFASTALSTFIPVAKSKGLKFLLPDPTEREIKRQIKERSDEALKALDEARRKAPFLAKWKSWPSRATPGMDEWEVNRIARGEWNAFVEQFDVVRLGYEGVQISTVMKWYDTVQAPFREGKKRKEFPDAFAIATLSTHAEKTGAVIAVVSEDPDFKMACERFASLLYFPALPRLTELLLLSDKDQEAVREMVVANSDKLEAQALRTATMLDFFHVVEGVSINDHGIESVELSDIHIVGLGHESCTLTFIAVVEYRVDLRWVDASDPYGEPTVVKGHLYGEREIPGTAKVEFGRGEQAKFVVSFLEFDEDEIEVRSVPEPYDRD